MRLFHTVSLGSLVNRGKDSPLTLDTSAFTNGLQVTAPSPGVSGRASPPLRPKAGSLTLRRRVLLGASPGSSGAPAGDVEDDLLFPFSFPVFGLSPGLFRLSTRVLDCYFL
jgi:hypothetical protein